mgnify:CR=1 FL=1
MHMGINYPVQLCQAMRFPQLLLNYFFFQAEDGIRDFHVTGVQTCALPIYKPEDAIECYQSFHSKLKELKSSNTSDFGNMLKKWREVNDTVKKFLAKDSVLVKDMVVAGKYIAMKDSVKNQMIRLTETWRYNYNDVMQIKEQTSPFIDDETLLAAVREYEPFFSSLNTVQVKPSNKNKVLKQYRDFLHEAKIQGFSNKDDLLKFIRHEDRSEEHTSELQSRANLVCRLLLEKKKSTIRQDTK